ncbi:hypothetical protein KFZ70_11390 [Tamlana fucoidanivorans]|uniref:Uncharacterized protein n=1 Tax=Allotamlana fucoidanivorans TaxID=2583814 RepID=A0A5C4SHJ4_9FLAO|nr:hypothetical protein [Tamlana fucoidanivorans]TNJ43125.1 hypothetical protein FGF67_12250 [Tamlana fucoidanivorans]
MEKKPIVVQLVGQDQQHYLIKFPNLEIPVKVNQNLFMKMKFSQEYLFSNLNTTVSHSNSA